MIRLLHVISDTNIGGAGHQLLTLLKGLDTTKYQIKAIVPEKSRLTKLLKQEGISLEEIPYIADTSFSIKAVWRLYKTIKKFKPDIVHTHAVLSARIAARIYGSLIIHTRHSVFPLTKWQKRLKIFTHLTETLLGGKIIAVSPAAKDNLTEMGISEKKIKVVYNGVPEVKACTEDEKQLIRAKHGIPPEKFVFAKIARLDAVKGHDYVLDAAKKIDGFFLFAGAGERMEAIAKRIETEAIQNVRILGFVEQIEEILNIADALVLASFGTEATSLALLQGMSLGKPAVVTDYGGNPYVIENERNGLLVPVKNSELLIKAMNRLIHEKNLYESLGKNARNTYKERFTEKSMVKQTTELYNELHRKTVKNMN